MPDRIINAATCLGCGCTCDDITLVVRDDRIVEARQACPLGAAWFGDGRMPAGARVDGRDVGLDAAVEAAAGLLSRAARPLVFIAPDVTCDAQREATALADHLPALLDTVTTATTGTSILAAQARGRAGATLSEVKNRADVVVFWGVDPAVRYPRFQSRYAPDPAGLSVPDGRRSRTVIAVDLDDRRGPADADLRVTIAKSDEVAALTALTAMVQRMKPQTATDGGGLTPVEQPAQVGMETVAAATAYDPALRALAPALINGRYVALVADAEPDGPADADRAEALIVLAQGLNGPTRAALVTLRGGGNRSGADAVLTAQTGYPMAVDFSRGYPRYTPHHAAASRLAAKAIDAIAIVGSAAQIPSGIRDAMAGVPAVAIGPRATESAWRDRGIAIDTGVAGIHESGTALRMDDVPLPLRAAIAGAPAAAAIVAQLVWHVRGHRAAVRQGASR